MTTTSTITTNTLVSKLITITKATLGLGLLALVITTGFNSSLSAHAGGFMGGDYAKVSADILNVRDKNCKKITSIKKDNMVIFDKSEAPNDSNPISIDCKIGNKMYYLAQVNFGINDSIDGIKYVATEYLTFVGRINFDTRKPVFAKEDVNLRDKNCKKIKTLKADTKANLFSAGTEIINCKINGVSYDLINMSVDGVVGYSATEFWTHN
jgi:hypothetical protein